MHVSESTLTILKNFAQINPSLLFPQGNHLSTLSPKKNILAKATITDTIPDRFAIYDLNQFLDVVSLFKEPEFDIQPQHVVIKNGSGHLSKYFFADESMIEDVPDKDMSINAPVVDVSITDVQLKSDIQAARVMSVPHITVESKDTNQKEGGQVILLKACNIQDAGSNTWELEIGDLPTHHKFRYIFSVENLRLLPGNYNLQISKEGVAQFTLIPSKDVVYWIATEHESKYDG